MGEIATSVNFLDIKISIINNELAFDIYYKPTNSFTYLKFTSCHPGHTRNNISLSLGRKIVRIVSSNRDKRLDELKEHLILRKHPGGGQEKNYGRYAEIFCKLSFGTDPVNFFQLLQFFPSIRCIPTLFSLFAIFPLLSIFPTHSLYEPILIFISV